MAYRFIQFDAVTGRLRGSTETAEMGPDGPISPRGTIVIDSREQPDAATAVRYDAGTRTFEQPPPRRRPLSKFEFMSLLTPQERMGLRGRVAAGDAVLGDAFEMLGLAAYVEPGHAMTVQMLNYVQSINVMTPQRRAEFEAAMAALAASAP